MKNTTHWFGFALAAVLAATGCKTPQLAWWKSSKSAEATTLADAPVSPAAAAKQAEQIAPTSTQLVGNEAPPYTPTPDSSTTPAGTAQPGASGAAAGLAASTPPASYPKTSAPAYTPENMAAVVAVTPPADPPTQQQAAPIYNAQQPPQSPLVQQQPAATPASRYGQPGPGENPENQLPPSESLVGTQATPPANAAVGDRYGTSSAPAATNPIAANPAATNSAATNVAATNQQRGMSNNAPGIGPEVQNLSPYPDPNLAGASAVGSGNYSSTVATLEPYRPGGTSTYPGALVANNPASKAPSSTGSGAPSGEDEAETTPSSSRRYW